MADYYIHLEDMAVGYHGKPLIHDINIGIYRGEIITLIGPNGSGKSTILKSITRQLRMLGGTVWFEEKDIRRMSYRTLSSHMAVMLTERVRTELMTCRDIVAAGRYPYTGRLGILSRRDEEKVDAALRAVHAKEVENRDFNAISDGQKQRVMLARAICQEPDIMVLDEPTSFLDIRHKLELLSVLREMAKKEKITVIMSLHEIDLAQKISDKVLCVNGETISHYGVPEDIFREKIIRELYGIDNGFFDPCFGSVELPRPKGEPKVLVISSGGTGIPVYRQLQKENRAFIAGILYRNDIDYQLARLLASRVIAEEPFHEIGDMAYDAAMEAVYSCDGVIDAGTEIGPCNRRIADILDEARRLGKL